MTTNSDSLTSADLMRMIGKGPEDKNYEFWGLKRIPLTCNAKIIYTGPTFNLPADPVQIDQNKADANAVEYLRAWLRGKGYKVDMTDEPSDQFVSLWESDNEDGWVPEEEFPSTTLSRALAAAVVEVADG